MMCREFFMMTNAQLQSAIAEALARIVDQEIPEEFINRITNERLPAFRRAIEEGCDEAEACEVAASGVRSTPGFRDLLRYLR